MRRVLALAAAGEIATGSALLLRPSLVGRLLLGEDLAGVAIPVARVAGIALIGLGIACWPGTPIIGMLIYSAAVALYLAYVGLAGGPSGMLLWPAVVLHATLATPLAVAWWRSRWRRKEISPDGTARSVPSSKETWPSWLDIHRCCYAAGAELRSLGSQERALSQRREDLVFSPEGGAPYTYSPTRTPQILGPILGHRMILPGKLGKVDSDLTLRNVVF